MRGLLDEYGLAPDSLISSGAAPVSPVEGLGLLGPPARAVGRFIRDAIDVEKMKQNYIMARDPNSNMSPTERLFALNPGMNFMGGGAIAPVKGPGVVLGSGPVRRSTDLKDLRKMDAKSGAKEASKDKHLIKSGDKAEGLYVGGPRDVKTKQQLNKLRKEFDEFVDQDPRGSTWYDRTRAAIKEVTGGNKNQADWMAAQHGQFSAGVDPRSEMGFALKENNASVAGMPIKAARPAQHEAQKRAVAMNDPTQYQLGAKTGEYARRINPTQPNVISATGVNDFRHARNFGYTDASGAAQRDALTDAQHRFLDYETAAAVDRANKRGLDGRKDWTGEQLQAAPWVRQKALAILEQRPAILERYLKKGIAEDKARELAYEEAFGEATKTIGEQMDGFTAFATHEAQPGPNTGNLPLSQNASEGQRAAYAADQSSWANAPGERDAIYSGLTVGDTGNVMRVRPTQKMQGVYQPPGKPLETNVGEVARPLVAFKSGGVKTIADADRGLLEAGESLRAFVDAQDAGAAHITYGGGAAGKSNSLFIPMDKSPTKDQLMAIREIGKKQGLGDVVDTGQGVTVTNFEKSPPKKSAKEVKGLLDDITEIIEPGAKKTRGYRVNVDGVFEGYVDAWKAGEGSGAASKQLLSKINKTPEIRAAFDNNPYIAKNSLDRLLRDKKWSKKWGPVRKDIQKARQIISEGPGWVGKLEKLVKKGVLPSVLLGGILANAEMPGKPTS